jgi:hypothetical protein
MGDRADLMDGVAAMVNAFISANPTLLHRHFDARPPAFEDIPCSYLDIDPATVHYDSGLRDRVITAALTFVDIIGSNQEASDRMDALVDAFTEHLDSYAHIVANTWWSDAQWSNVDETLGGQPPVPTSSMRLTFDVHFKVGRL